MTPTGFVRHRIHLLTKVAVQEKTVEGSYLEDIFTFHEQVNGTTVREKWKSNPDFTGSRANRTEFFWKEASRTAPTEEDNPLEKTRSQAGPTKMTTVSKIHTKKMARLLAQTEKLHLTETRTYILHLYETMNTALVNPSTKDPRLRLLKRHL